MTITRRQVLLGALAVAPLLRSNHLRPPVVATGAASGVTQTSATLNGSVNPRGAPTTARFEWGLTTAYGNATPDVSVGSGKQAVAVSAPVSGLAPGTLYHFRVRATNAAGTVSGADATFTTAPAAGTASAFTTGVSATGGPDAVGGTGG